MRHHLAATAALLAVLTLAGCSTSDSGDTKPTPKPTASATTAAATTAPALSAEEQRLLCQKEIVAELLAREPGEPGDDPSPAACQDLSTDDYLTALLYGTQEVNQAHRDELQRQMDEAAESDAP